MIRSTIIKAVLSVSTLVLGTCGFAQAQTWPARPITMVVPFAAGGSTDITARMLAEKLGGILGQNIVVENRTGAGGNIGAAAVARATPDGYTILLHTSTLTANVSLYKNMGLNVQKDLIPVSQVALIPNVLMVNNDFQAKTLKDFVEVVKQKRLRSTTALRVAARQTTSRESCLTTWLVATWCMCPTKVARLLTTLCWPVRYKPCSRHW